MGRSLGESGNNRRESCLFSPRFPLLFSVGFTGTARLFRAGRSPGTATGFGAPRRNRETCMSDVHQHQAGEPSPHDHDASSGRGRARADAPRDAAARGGSVLTVRAHSGLSGDMFLAGLMRMTGMEGDALDGLLGSILPELAGSVRLIRREVNHVGGWHAEVTLPHQHVHRSLADIVAIIASSGLSPAGRELSTGSFTLLAEAEAAVHGKRPEDVRFHEVGALDSILDICLSCELFARLDPSRFVVSPLPMADGEVSCAHGILPVPAPAVLELLEGVPVRPFAGRGETVTPTALALLRSLGAQFGPWPAMRVERRALVYGTYVFENAPNGAMFAWGRGTGNSGAVTI